MAIAGPLSSDAADHTASGPPHAGHEVHTGSVRQMDVGGRVEHHHVSSSTDPEASDVLTP